MLPGGAQGVLVLATQSSAFKAAVEMCRPRGTVVCIGLPSGSFDCPILDVVMKRLTIRGSLVGTRQVHQSHMNSFKTILDTYSRIIYIVTAITCLLPMTRI